MTWRAAGSLAQRELVRFFRQRSRVLSALATPLLIWVLVGSGFAASFRPPGAPAEVGALEFFFPGMLLMIVLFTAIFATISIIEDRREGFLQSVLVAPVSRAGIVLGKMLGGTALALVQVLPVLVVAPLVGLRATPTALVLAGVALAVVAFGLTGLGVAIAWRLDTIQGFHAIMNLFLMPMWMLSGALFPANGAPDWLRAVMAANPMTYALGALRRALYVGSQHADAAAAGTPPLALAFVVAVVFAVAMFAVALRQSQRTTAGDLH
jgi:ABC-2 type transport system permease protein